MSQTAITLAFENWKAQQGATGEPVLLDEFVFASVPDLNPDTFQRMKFIWWMPAWYWS